MHECTPPSRPACTTYRSLNGRQRRAGLWFRRSRPVILTTREDSTFITKRQEKHLLYINGKRPQKFSSQLFLCTKLFPISIYFLHLFWLQSASNKRSLVDFRRFRSPIYHWCLRSIPISKRIMYHFIIFSESLPSPIDHYCSNLSKHFMRETFHHFFGQRVNSILCNPFNDCAHLVCRTTFARINATPRSWFGIEPSYLDLSLFISTIH